MRQLLSFAAGPRAKWIVAAVWLGVTIASLAGGLLSKYSNAEDNKSTTFLPSGAESTHALTVIDKFTNGEQQAVVIVFARNGGLTSQDDRIIADDRDRLNRRIATMPAIYAGAKPFGSPIFSTNGRAALLVGSLPSGSGNSKQILKPIQDIRAQVDHDVGGLVVKVTGPAGAAADAISIFQSINGKLIAVAGLLVFVLLILIYRSPIFFWIPLAAVGVAEIMTRSVGYVLTQVGVTINGQTSSILSVLVLGAGTDYALLLVARYREELHNHENKHAAVAAALQTAGPAIIASALTVMVALLCLSVAEVRGTAGLGPIAAVGVFIAMLAMMTLLPALLAITGRRAFWRPSVFGRGNGIPHFGEHGADEAHGPWRRIGEFVNRHPRRIGVTTVAILSVMVFGWFSLNTGLTQSNAYSKQVESQQGQQLLAQSFPAGANAPTQVVVPNRAKADAVAASLETVPGVTSVNVAAVGAPGVLLNVVLAANPFSTAAYNLIPLLRETAKSAGGPNVLVGGQSALQYDVRVAAARDTTVIIPLALALVFLILVFVLRAVAVSLILIATVILSFAATLGIGLFMFAHAANFAGVDPSFPLYAFIFLVALGIDYNIFLMVRAREETKRFGTQQGMLRALAVTGGVITSAGIVLAGTFMVLAVLPLVFLIEIGSVVAFGVLLDTFVVRSILVPALVLSIGRRVWLPSRLAKEGVAG